jgi:ABC-type transporter Mla MlaB component
MWMFHLLQLRPTFEQKLIDALRLLSGSRGVFLPEDDERSARLAAPETPQPPKILDLGVERERKIISIVGHVAPSDIPELCRRALLLLQGAEAGGFVCDVAGLDQPDAAAIDALGHLQLMAGRMGRHLELRHASGELRDLLDLMGLQDALPVSSGSPFEPSGETEKWEESGGVEEEAHSGYTPVPDL